MNKNKKKILVVALLLFAAIGFAGYGAYSYYWTQGEFNNDEYSIVEFDVTFDPEAGYLGSDSNYAYIDNSGDYSDIALECSIDDTTGKANCEGSKYYRNDGSTVVYLSVSDEYSSVNGNDKTTEYPPHFNWTSDSLQPGETTHLTVNLYNIDLNSDVYSDEAVEVTEPVSGETLSVRVTYSMHASMRQ